VRLIPLLSTRCGGQFVRNRQCTHRALLVTPRRLGAAIICGMAIDTAISDRTAYRPDSDWFRCRTAFLLAPTCRRTNTDPLRQAQGRLSSPALRARQDDIGEGKGRESADARVGVLKLYGRRGVYYGHACGRREVEGIRRNGRIRLLAAEAKARYGAIGFFDLDSGDASLRGHSKA
jgi:hypothetical protein